MGSHEGEKGNLFWKERWIGGLEKSVGIFVMVSIRCLSTVKYWKDLRGGGHTKYKIPK